MDTPENFTTAAAADHLGLARRTLERWRLIHQGPPYRKLGRRVVYPRAELDEWAIAKTVTPEQADSK